GQGWQGKEETCGWLAGAGRRVVDARLSARIPRAARQKGSMSSGAWHVAHQRRVPARVAERAVRNPGIEPTRNLHELDEIRHLPKRRQRACLLPFDLHETGKCIERRGTGWRDRINCELITRRVNGKCRRSLGHAIENARFSVGRRSDTAVSRMIGIDAEYIAFTGLA